MYGNTAIQIYSLRFPRTCYMQYEKREIKLTSSPFVHQTLQLDGKKLPKANTMLAKRAIMKKNSQNRTVITKAAKCDGLDYRILIAFRRNDGCRFIISCIASSSLLFQPGYQSELKQKQNAKTNKITYFCSKWFKRKR